MRKIFSLFAAMMLLVSTLSATTIYCKMDKAWWTQDGAAVAVHHWGGSSAGTTWPGVRMNAVDGQEGLWSYDVPADVTGLIFVRVNDSGDIADWGAKTKDLTLPTDGKNLFTITNETETWGDPGCDGEWSVYGAEPVADEWLVISFAEAATADEIAEDAAYAVPGTEFALTLHDAGNKMVIDENDCRFGTAEAYTMYNFRLKSGGASGSDKNYFTLNSPEAGTLRIAPRTGSNSATDRALIVIQGGETLYNQIVQESQAIEVQEGENTVKVYPYVDVTVAAGEVVVRYTAGMNFYAFAFQAAGVEPQPENPIDHVYFATGDGWDEDSESSAVWDAETGKITVTLAQPKVAAWQGQVFVNAVKAEVGKLYNFSVKMKANKNMGGVTMKWQENNNDPIMVSEINTISLVADEEFVYSKEQIEGQEGNGMIVYDFGFAEAGTVVEIYDLVIEELEPEPLEWVIFGVNVPVNGKPESIELFGAFGDPIALEENAETHWYLNYDVNVAASAEFSVRAAGEEQNEIYVLNGTEWELATFKFGELWKDDTWKGDPCKMIELDLTGANYAWSVALPEGITNTTVEAAIVKTIENGQLVIIKNGVRYNAQGTVVK